MKAIRGKILVEVDMGQKSDFEYETPGGLRLWGNKDFGWNQITTAPVVSTVIDPGGMNGLNPGDNVLSHHNSFNREVGKSGSGNYHGDTGVRHGKKHVFGLEHGMVYFRIGDDGEPYPLDDWMICERVPREYAVEGIVIPDSVTHYYPNLLKVIRVGPNCPGVNPGDTVVTYNNSGVDVEYTHDFKNKTAVRCQYDTVLGIKNG